MTHYQDYHHALNDLAAINTAKENVLLAISQHFAGLEIGIPLDDLKGKVEDVINDEICGDIAKIEEVIEAYEAEQERKHERSESLQSIFI